MKQIRLSRWVGGWLPGIRDKGTTTTVHIRKFINLKVFLFVFCFLFSLFFCLLACTCIGYLLHE